MPVPKRLADNIATARAYLRGDVESVPRLCGLSNCFRPAVGKRGFLKVCAVHKADPRKWPDGRFTGTQFVKGNERLMRCGNCGGFFDGPGWDHKCPQISQEAKVGAEPDVPGIERRGHADILDGETCPRCGKPNSDDCIPDGRPYLG